MHTGSLDGTEIVQMLPYAMNFSGKFLNDYRV